jgi:DNA-binding NarL/FixJ family response regulator
VEVLLVDDGIVVREALRVFLELQDDIQVVGEANLVAEAVALDIQPDVVITEFKLPDARGRDAVTALRERFPDGSILVLTHVRHPARLGEAVTAGAHGYLLKSATPEELFDGIRAVANGESYLQPSLGVAFARWDARTGLDEGGPSGRLSPQEEEVLRLVALGFTNAEIAARVGVSLRTVEGQRARVLQKLGHPTRAELVRYALDSGLFELGE